MKSPLVLATGLVLSVEGAFVAAQQPREVGFNIGLRI